MGIKIEHLEKRFGAFAALDDIHLEIREGELLALLGPSGSGKTTLLRVIAGLEHADRGRVLFGGEDASQLSVQDRRVGFVFQHYALFRHMTVADNIAFGLKVRRSRDRWPAAVPEHSRIVQPFEGAPAERANSVTRERRSFPVSFLGSRASPTPREAAASRRLGSTSSPTTDAPRSAAISAAKVPTPPSPTTTARSPPPRPDRSTAW